MRGVHRSARSEVGLVGTGPSPLSCVTAGPTSGPSAITPAGGGLGLLSENQVFVAGRRAGRCVSESSKWQLTPGWPVWTQPLKGQGREPGARQELWAHQSGENWVPPKGAPKSCGLELTKVTGLGRRVFAGVIALRVSRCRHRARGWPACSDWSHVREERAWGAEPQGERPRDDPGEEAVGPPRPRPGAPGFRAAGGVSRTVIPVRPRESRCKGRSMRGTAGDTGPGGPWPGGLRDLRSAWPPRPPSPHGRWSRSPAQHTGDGLRASGCFRGTGARMRLGAPLPGHLWQRRGAPVRGHPCSRAQRLPEKELKLTLGVAGRRCRCREKPPCSRRGPGRAPLSAQLSHARARVALPACPARPRLACSLTHLCGRCPLS